MAIAINPVFAVPFAQDFLPDEQRLNRDLRALLLAREQEGGRYANPTPSLAQQQGVFESAFNLFSWKEACIQELRQFCWGALGQTLKQLNQYEASEMDRLQIYSHTWYHVTRNGGFTILHTHPMASWSGVYCVSPGEHDPARPESGVLRFHNPHHYSNYFLDAGNQCLKPPYHHGTWSLRFKAGDLVLFPSWLQHEVLPFFGSGERITVAFNCWFAMKGADEVR